jgi:hypothetical protein
MHTDEQQAGEAMLYRGAAEAGQLAMRYKLNIGKSPSAENLDAVVDSQQQLEDLPARYAQGRENVVVLREQLGGTDNGQMHQAESAFARQLASRKAQLSRRELWRRHPLSAGAATFRGAVTRRPITISGERRDELAHARAQRTFAKARRRSERQ